MKCDCLGRCEESRVIFPSVVSNEGMYMKIFAVILYYRAPPVFIDLIFFCKIYIVTCIS